MAVKSLVSRRPLSLLRSAAAAASGRGNSTSISPARSFGRDRAGEHRGRREERKRTSVAIASMPPRPPPPPTSTVDEVFVETEQGIGTFTYRWPRPGLTADVVLVAEPGVAPESALATPGGESSPSSSTLLLIERKRPPGAGRWALPGGFVNEGEGLEAAAQRELKEETGVSVVAVGTEGTEAGGAGASRTGAIAIEQTRSYGDARRDPRGWTVTVAFAGVARARHEEHREAAAATAGSDDAADARWWPVARLPPMAFDHKVIVRDALRKLLDGERDEESPFARDLKAALGSEALKGDWR